MPPKKPGAVGRFVKRILKGQRLNTRPELCLQKIFADVCVRPSLELGLLSHVLTVSLVTISCFFYRNVGSM